MWVRSAESATIDLNSNLRQSLTVIISPGLLEILDFVFMILSVEPSERFYQASKRVSTS